MAVPCRSRRHELGDPGEAYGKLLDYEQFIDHQIQRTRTRIKVTDMITAGLTLVVAFLAVLFLEVVFDHVFGFRWCYGGSSSPPEQPAPACLQPCGWRCR